MNRTILVVIKIFIAAALLGLIMIFIDPGEIWKALKLADFRFVVFGVALMPLNIYLQLIKWRYLVRLVNPNITTGAALGSLLGGFSFGIVTPGRIGEYGRALYIKDTPTLNLIGLTVIDKFYNLGCTIAFGMPALFSLPVIFNFMHGYFFVSILLLIISADFTLLYISLDPRPVRSIIYALQMLFPKRDKIAQLLGGLDRFSSPQARLVLMWTILHYAVFHLQYFLLINGFASIDFFSSARAAASILFVKSVFPVAIGDLGLDQIVSMQFFGEFGVMQAQAFNASILLFASNVLLPSLIGILFIANLQIGKRKKRSE